MSPLSQEQSEGSWLTLTGVTLAHIAGITLLLGTMQHSVPPAIPKSLAVSLLPSSLPAEKSSARVPQTPASSQTKKNHQQPQSISTTTPNTTTVNTAQYTSASTNSGSTSSHEVSASAPAPITPPRFDADYLSNPAPAYPPISRRLGEQGRLLLNVLVGADGSTQQVSVAKSSGFSRLDEAATKAVWQWKFTPARQAGNLITASVTVPIVFKLD